MRIHLAAPPIAAPIAALLAPPGKSTGMAPAPFATTESSALLFRPDVLANGHPLVVQARCPTGPSLLLRFHPEGLHSNCYDIAGLAVDLNLQRNGASRWRGGRNSRVDLEQSHKSRCRGRELNGCVLPIDQYDNGVHRAIDSVCRSSSRMA